VGELRLLEKRRQFQEDDPKLVPPDAKSGNDKAAAETKSGSEHRLARADAFDPAPKHCRGKSEKKMARLKIHASEGCDQSSGADLVTPMVLVSGNLKTLNA